MSNTLRAALVLTLLAAPAFADKKVDDAVANAEEKLQKGKPEDGLKVLEKLVSQVTTSEAYVALARYQQKMGSPDQLEAASQSAAKALELASSASPAQKAQAFAYASSLDLIRGTGQDALAHAQQAVAAEANAESLSALARAQARNQDGVAALASADKAAQLTPTSALAQEARGDALLVLKRNDEAVAAYRKASELDPKLNRARIGLSSALLADGKAADAQAAAKQAVDSNEQSAEAYAARGLATLAGAPGNQAKWTEAISDAQQGAFLNPKSVAVQLAVGRIFEAAGNYDQAVAAFKRAYEIDPGYAPASLALIKVQERKGDVDGALAAAQKLVASTPKSGEAQFLVGKLLLRKNDFAGALQYLAAAETLSPGLAEAHAYAGTAYQYTGRTPEALAAYKKAVELDPQNLSYRATYGLLLGLSGDYDAGAAELQKVVSTPGYKDSAGYTNLGWIYRSMDPRKPVEAVAAYKKALELDPTNEQAALGMGWAYSYSKDYDSGIAAFQKAVQIEPKVAPEAYNGIAWCDFFKRDMDQAKEFLAKAQAAGRSDPKLADNIEKVEKLKAQKEAYEAALKKFEEERAKAGPDIRTLLNRASRGDVGAVRELAEQGSQAVSALIRLIDDSNPLPVRDAAVGALGSMGPTAKQALPYLMELLKTECGKTIMTPEEMKKSLACEDLKRKGRDAVLKIKR
jgi:tetratricopeptide (TPR) repeat protein